MAAEIIAFSKSDEMPLFGAAILEPGGGWFTTNHANKMVELVLIHCVDTKTVWILRGQIEEPKYQNGNVIVNDEVVAKAIDLDKEFDDLEIGQTCTIDFIQGSGKKGTVVVKNLGEFDTDIHPN
jgi:hypothetical protein